MNRYPHEAITLKTLDYFSYDVYSAISVNMLKYNHDTSATIRLLSTIINTSREIAEDLPYQISFNLKGMDFISIDRMNAFYWPKIKGFEIDEFGDTNCLFGYSRYTDKTYLMKRINKQSDFVRHSLPIDSFFSGAIFPGTRTTLLLHPYIKNKIDAEIKNSQITIKPYEGFRTINLDSGSPVKIVVDGVDIRGNITKEEINIVADINYVTNTEWKRITGFLALNTSATVSIIFYPYIAGNIVLSDDLIIDRQQFEPGVCLLTVDSQKQQLVYNLLRENLAEYPLGYDILKTVPLSITDGHDILSYYIDEPNKLLYTIHGLKTIVQEGTPAGTGPAPLQTYYQWINALQFDPGPKQLTLNADPAWVWDTENQNFYLPTLLPTNRVVSLGCMGTDWSTKPINAYPNAYYKFMFYHGVTDMYGNLAPVDIEITYSNGSTSTVSGASGMHVDMQGQAGLFITGFTLTFPSPALDYYGNPINPQSAGITGLFVWEQTQGYEYDHVAFTTMFPGHTEGIIPRDVPGEIYWEGADNGTLTIPKHTDSYGNISLPGTDTPGGTSYTMGFYAQDGWPNNLAQSTFNALYLIATYPAAPLPYVRVSNLNGDIVLDWTRVTDGVDMPFPTDSVGISYVQFGYPVAELSAFFGVDMLNAQVAPTYIQQVGFTNITFKYKYPTTAALPDTLHDVTKYLEHTFSCYPLIIPTTPDNTLDSEKTIYQAVSVEYEEDCISEEWNMWVFPTSKTNDVETLNITINGVTYIEGMLLDLIRFDINTNRITIPFADIYTDEISSAVVELETYGRERGYVKFRLDRTKLQPLYSKDLDNYLRRFRKIPAQPNIWTPPTISSTKVPYKSGDLMGWGDGKYGGMTETLPPKPFGWGGMMDVNYLDYYEMYKLSSTANVAVNGQKIVNIFNTFFADENNKYVITSDTITHIKGDSCTPSSDFKVIDQNPEAILGQEGLVAITFNAPPNIATVIPQNITLVGPSPWKLQNPLLPVGA